MAEKTKRVYPKLVAYDGHSVVSTEGISTREYFAAAALQGVLAAGVPGSGNPELLAGLAYKIADAMVKAGNGD